MTARQETIAKTVLLGFVLLFVVFFSRRDGPVRTVALGDPAPDFTLQTDDGRSVSLADYHGKVVVLNFWATWCLSCVDEMPSLKRFTDHYAGRDVAVIAVSHDQDPDAYKKFLAEHQINFLTLRNAPPKVAEMYGTYVLPETYIINHEGRVARKIIGPIDWASPQMIEYIDSLLAVRPTAL
jgi:peroxiredoxin